MTARAAGAGAGLLATPGINTGGGGLTPGPALGDRDDGTTESRLADVCTFRSQFITNW